MELTTNYTNDNYTVVVKHGAITSLDVAGYDKVIAIIDEKVLKLHRERLTELISKAAVFPVAAGENIKTLAVYSRVINQIIDTDVTRNSVIVAVGGGSVGDFAGFIASTLLRGIDFIQVPTTILAHDSAIGGKVGINADGGKNLIGAFKRPGAVIYDLDFLSTLPYAEVLSGFGEVIKHAILDSEETLKELMTDFSDRTQLAALKGIDRWLVKGMEMKLKVVQADEYESGLRKTLNLGHTFGHAVEFVHHIPHGHAVMHGLLMTYLLSDREISGLLSWFKQLGFEAVTYQDFDVYYQLMTKDKKNRKDQIQFVLLKTPMLEAVSKERIQHAFNQLGGYYES